MDPLGLTAKDGVTTFYHSGDIKGPINPSFGLGGKDFDPVGKSGFYVTTDKTQAETWIHRRTDRNMSITKFEIPNSELANLNIKVLDSANGEWADFVTKARRGTLSHGYDAVSGPMINNPAHVRSGASPKPMGTQLAIYSKKSGCII